MAAPSRPRRVIAPIRRFGYDDDTDEDLSENSEDDNSISPVTSSSSSESSLYTDDEESQPPVPNVRLHPVYNPTSGWHAATPGTDSRPTAVPTYQAPRNPGIQVPMPSDPAEFTLQILDEEVFGLLAEWTNSRARQRNYSNVNRYGRRKHTVQWQEVTADDMKKFFAMLLVMGIVKKPRIRDYFSENVYLDTPFFRRSDTFSRDKFALILSNLRFANYDPQRLPQRMEKIAPIIELLRTKVQSVYQIDGEGSIDEFLLLHKGNLYFKQYIPKKRARFGMKGHSLNEADTGYTYDCLLYTSPSPRDLSTSRMPSSA